MNYTCKTTEDMNSLLHSSVFASELKPDDILINVGTKGDLVQVMVSLH